MNDGAPNDFQRRSAGPSVLESDDYGSLNLECLSSRPPNSVRVPVSDLFRDRVKEIGEGLRSGDNRCRGMKVNLDQYKVLDHASRPSGRPSTGQGCQSLFRDFGPSRSVFRRYGIVFDVEDHDVSDDNFRRVQLSVRRLADHVVDSVGNGSAQILQYGFQRDPEAIFPVVLPSDVPPLVSSCAGNRRLLFDAFQPSSLQLLDAIIGQFCQPSRGRGFALKDRNPIEAGYCVLE